MTERTRRYPKRPAVFWAVFGAVGLLSLGAAGGLWLKASPHAATAAPR